MRRGPSSGYRGRQDTCAQFSPTGALVARATRQLGSGDPTSSELPGSEVVDRATTPTRSRSSHAPPWPPRCVPESGGRRPRARARRTQRSRIGSRYRAWSWITGSSTFTTSRWISWFSQTSSSSGCHAGEAVCATSLRAHRPPSSSTCLTDLASTAAHAPEAPPHVPRPRRA
jgi:hypothetical protein